MCGNKYCSEIKSKILSDYNNGITQKEISLKYSIPKSTISRIIKRGNVVSCHKGGRPRKTTDKKDRKITNFFKKHPQATSKEVKVHMELDINPSTGRRRILQAAIQSFRPAKKPFISKENQKARLTFARTHLDWTLQKWKTVLFSNESKFNRHESDGRQHVRRPRSERLNPKYTKGTVKHGGGNVMVWGCFSGQGIGLIRRVEGIMVSEDYKQILKNTMLPYAEWKMPLVWWFQHDNDPKYTSKLVKAWISEQHINILQWLPQSSDLNPIENLWEIVKRRIGNQILKKREDHVREIEKQCNKIPKTFIDNLIAPMLKRCASVTKNKGYAIKY